MSQTKQTNEEDNTKRDKLLLILLCDLYIKK